MYKSVLFMGRLNIPLPGVFTYYKRRYFGTFKSRYRRSRAQFTRRHFCCGPRQLMKTRPCLFGRRRLMRFVIFVMKADRSQDRGSHFDSFLLFATPRSLWC
ncbi:hypothetical protein CEXT_544861 [Caerostris extrusa]|uniref:Uncharacterized protein n=1 Tax=Caerostris extrusa TaxID=172846 RepID=A0AAV4R242_CAEEX|nr:hypothetical protein CEXT_544861 [Caerostris extrusa]